MPRPGTASLRRSVRMFRAFRREQADGAAFYRLLAEDSAAQVAGHADLAGARVLDVGGGPGYFHDAFSAHAAVYAAVESDPAELTVHGGRRAPRTVLASGTSLPFPDGSWDVVYCSNVLEHVADPERLADELLRVVRPAGVLVLAYTLWWGPHGGHETAPWHYLGGHRARRRYERRNGHPPKNVFGTSMFAATAAWGLRWARSRPDATLQAAYPRYHPRWAHGIVHLPGVREVLAWNLVLVLRKR